MRIIASIIICLTYGLSFAQDVHFSHIHASPTFLNPAMNGLFDGGRYRFIINSRLQWENFTKGYKTIAGSVDGKVAQSRNGNIFGAGLQFFSDKAGDLNFSTNSAALSFSALQPLDRRGDSFISIGLQGGLFNQHFDPSKMVGYEIESLGSEGINNSITAWDVSAGIGWHYARNHQEYYYFGLSVFHINQPVVTFFNESSNSETSILEIAQLILKLVEGTESQIEHVDGRPGDVLRLYSDTTKFRQSTGWKPSVTLEEGLLKTIDWFRAKAEKENLMELETALNWK